MAKARKTGASFDDLSTAFRHGKFAPLYFLYGEEGWFIDELERLAIQHAIAPHERDFNLDVVFGPEANAQAALAQCAQFPMMTERRLVVVRGFEKLDGNAAFEAYAKAPNPTATVLLLCHRKPDLRSRPYAALKKAAVWSHFETLKDRQLPSWVEGRFRDFSVSSEAGAASTLAELSGPDLRSLDAEVDKLVTYVGDRARVTRDDVLRAAGHSAEQNPFALQAALGRGDVTSALAIADGLLGKAGNRSSEAIRIVALLSAYLTKLWKLTGCLAAGVPQSQWAGQIGVPPFVVREYEPPARRYGPDGIRRALGALLAADLELKGGARRDPRLTLTLALRRAAAPSP
ncbi:DNA polymerase III subunit delta [Rubrivirga sp.]|uniref:DNA polymerase III subunit delta n=1 Tax=Rubrivirga sp. TaxID=1885344 RepID=UPI003C7894BB